VVQPELGTERCSSVRLSAKSASRTGRGKGISTTPPPCTCPTSALPKRNSRPPNMWVWTAIFGHAETSSSNLFRYFMSSLLFFFDVRYRSCDSVATPQRLEGRPSRNQIPRRWLCALVRLRRFLPSSNREPIEMCQTDCSVHPLALILLLGKASEIRRSRKWCPSWRASIFLAPAAWGS
jgi:hypothetical protein